MNHIPVAKKIRFWSKLSHFPYQRLLQLSFQPSAVFLLAVACVILNTYAVGVVVPFKYAVIISPILCVGQAFLTLPFQIKAVQSTSFKK